MQDKQDETLEVTISCNEPLAIEARRSTARLLRLLEQLPNQGSPSLVVGTLHELGSAAYEESGRILRKFEDVMD